MWQASILWPPPVSVGAVVVIEVVVLYVDIEQVPSMQRASRQRKYGADRQNAGRAHCIKEKKGKAASAFNQTTLPFHS